MWVRHHLFALLKHCRVLPHLPPPHHPYHVLAHHSRHASSSNTTMSMAAGAKLRVVVAADDPQLQFSGEQETALLSAKLQQLGLTHVSLNYLQLQDGAGGWRLQASGYVP